MLEIKQGTSQDASALSELIFLSAPKLLPYLFGSEAQAKHYLSQACAQDDGQYSANRHSVVSNSENLIGSISLWHNQMPQAFHDGTIKSLAYHLNTSQLSHIVRVNETLRELFTPPAADELCIGHLAVDEQWRGQKIGSKLISFALGQAKSMGKTKLILDVEEGNSEALHFYEKWHFSSAGTKPFLPTTQRYLRMEKVVDDNDA